jgi:DNA-binding transcriptional ArsR family regulator
MERTGLGRALRRKVGLKEDSQKEVITRPSGNSIMMNIKRQRIFEHLCNYPCNNLRSISRALKVSPPTASWHLALLNEGDFIIEISHKNKKIFYPKELIEREDIAIFHLLNQKNARMIYKLIQKKKGITQSEIIKKTALSQQLTSLTLMSLEAYHLISSTKKGKNKRYQVTGKIENLEKKLEKNNEFFLQNLLDRLKKDGVNPQVIKSYKNHLILQLEIGREHISTIKITKNPLRSILTS